MRPIFTRTLLWITLFGGIAGVILWTRLPVNSTSIRLLLLGSLGLAWITGLALAWKLRPLRYGILALPFLLPGREMDRDELRARYVAEMRGFENCPYHWGGESSLGIDCSGLPRRALQNALFQYGLRRLDGGALRASAMHWWFDASALALSQGYREYAMPVGVRGKLRELDYSALQPGDFAVTTSGVHMLAFLGGEDWIQADPEPMKVVADNGRTTPSGWFDQEVATYRWRELAAP